jgi:hypothetical protein
LFPAIATKVDELLYSRLLAEATARDTAIEKQIRQAGMRAVTPEAQQRALGKVQKLETAQHPLKIARSNLLTAQYAKGNDDVTARLLLSTTDDGQRHLGSLLHRGIGEHRDMPRGLPENGVYLEGLASEVPGGGTQLLKELESQFPGTPMYLESVNNPATKEFYLKKGFLPRPDGSSGAIPRNLWIKPADVKVKAKGGPVKIARGGLASLKGTKRG